MVPAVPLESLLSTRMIECSGRSGNRSWHIEYKAEPHIVKHIVSPSVIFRHGLLADLEAAGSPPPGYVIPAIRSQDDTVERKGLWVVTRFCQGRPYSVSQNDINSLFRYWYRLRAWSDAQGDWLQTLARPHSLRWLAASEDIQTSLEAVFALLDDCDHGLLASRIRSGIALVLQQGLFALHSWSRHGLIHGDLHGGNLVYSNAEIAAVVDWDEVAYGPPEFDLAKGMWLLCRRTRGQFDFCISTLRYYLARAAELKLAPNFLIDVGALAFVPTSAHILHLIAHDRSHGGFLMPWYVGWLHAFWDEFPSRREFARHSFD